MDSLSQIVLGASVAEASLGKKVGNKAIFWGAVVGTLPDLDVLSKYFVDTVSQLWFHRTITHSLVFCFAFAPIIGYIINAIHKKDEANWKDWTMLSFWCLVTHPLLDCFTTWGTMFFWPFTEYRIAWKTIFVVDPLYTIPFLVLVTWAMFYKRNNPLRFKLNTLGLGISSFYLLLTMVSKQVANSNFEKGFDQASIIPNRYDSRPTPLNNILWTVNAEMDSDYIIGYYSHLDDGPNSEFQTFRKNHALLKPYLNNQSLQTLLEITQGYYTVEQIDQYIFLVNDLRFGQVYSHTRDTGFFVFTYQIDASNFILDGSLNITQRDNDFKSTSAFLPDFYDRVLGK